MQIDLPTALSGAAGLTGVQWLLHESPARHALHDTLGALLTRGFALADIQIQRAKYKPGRRLTTHYAVRARCEADGSEVTRLAQANLLPPGDPDRRGGMDALMDVQEEALRRGLVTPFRALMGDMAQIGLWLLLSPLDAAFPQLVRLSDPGYVRDLLAGVIPDAAARYQIDAIRYRPGERHVLRYQPADAGERGAGEGTLYAKIYNSDKGGRAFTTAASVAGWLADRGEAIAAVRPTTYIPAEGLALYPHVSGTPLSALLRHQGAETGRHLRAAGAALRALHDTPLDLVELRPHSLAAEIKSTASAAEHIHTLLPQSGARIAGILERARELHERLPQEPPGFTYGDYKSDHLWVMPGALTLIDFDTCYLFDQAIDVGKFLADLRWWYDHYGLPDVESAQAQFLAGYGVEAARLARARLYEVLVLVKTTARRVRLFEDDWAERTGRLVATADRLLAQAARF